MLHVLEGSLDSLVNRYSRIIECYESQLQNKLDTQIPKYMRIQKVNTLRLLFCIQELLATYINRAIL
jgi:hypothetical protein